ncbi:MAG: glycerol-3-phosphate transporter, partial [Burkholderiales bacterium]|nr:glycerol-3-phosphate transporter [Burkholderiales bacterium]
MVENRPWVNFIAHFTLIAGVLVVAFPLYITFIASTLTLDQINQVPMQLTPGSAMWDNYSQVLTAGSTRGSSAPVGQMMTNSLIMALVIAIGKIAISIISAFAIVYFQFPLRKFAFWMIFIT